MAIPPASTPNAGGLAFGDAAGYPNGRRPADEFVTIILRAVAGLLYPLIDKTYKVDAAVSLVSDGLGPQKQLIPVELPVPRDAGERLRHAATRGVEMERAMHTATIEHTHGGPAHSHEVGIATPASSASVALDIGAGAAR